MSEPRKVTCFSRPSRGKGGEVCGVEVCRQGHALWLGEHYDLDEFLVYMKKGKNKAVNALPLSFLAARRSSRRSKRSARSSSKTTPGVGGAGIGAGARSPCVEEVVERSPGIGAGGQCSATSPRIEESLGSLEDTFRLVLISDDMDDMDI